VFIFELVGREDHPAYQRLLIENLERQYSFLRSAVVASLAVGRPMLSLEVILSLNYHAISCLHGNAGKLRPCEVRVDDFIPPPHYEVPALMSMFIDEVNRNWESADPVVLAAFILWRLNHIHPFVNGNGRTARVTCYFALCCKIGKWLGGDTLLPELIRQNRDEYVAALKAVDAALPAIQLGPLHALLTKLLDQQMASVEDELGA
jgi:Fic family protein